MKLNKKKVLLVVFGLGFYSLASFAGHDGSQSYSLAMGTDAADRLALSEQVYGQTTKTLLPQLIDNLTGKKVLIMACGTGEQIPWLAEQVGTDGQVTCMDISEEQLAVAKKKAENLKNVSFGKLDILDEKAVSQLGEKGKYDLVMARFLLVHVVEPEKALNQMFSLVKDGGYLLAEELDVEAVQGVPDSVPIHEIKASIFLLGVELQVDYGYAKKLLPAFQKLGFPNPQEVQTEFVFSSGPEKSLFLQTVKEIAPGLLHYKIVSPEILKERIDQITQFTQDTTTKITLGKVFQVYTQKPENRKESMIGLLNE